MENNKLTNGIQVISRAVAILQVLDSTSRSLGNIAAQTGLPRSTVQRIVDALAQENLVECGSAGVRLSWGIQNIASKACSGTGKIAKPALERLFSDTHETVDISTARGCEVSFIERIISDQELRVVPFPDKPRPLHAMANGKALLSLYNDEQIRELYPCEPEALTPRTMTRLDDLMLQVAEIRRCGFAYDTEEHVVGVCGIGLPLPLPGRGDYALSVVMPASRFAESKHAVEKSLMICRDTILEALRDSH